jgi:hypothetical protein
MTDVQLQAIYQSGLGVSHIAALKVVFAAGYAAHAGTTVGACDPSVAASFPTSIPVVKDPNHTDHG